MVNCRRPRQFPCYFQNEGVLVTSLGDVYSCSITDKKLGSLRGQSASESILSTQAIAIRESVKNSDCINCIHDQTGAWTPYELIAERLQKTRLAGFIFSLRKVFRAANDIVFGTINRHLPVYPQKNGKHALLIGAFGGEHVGDAAILGGVVQRLVNKYPLESITVASFRPDRTSMWAEMLDLPVKVEVVLSTNGEIDKQLTHAAYVVYAGGPLMELPAQLAKHLAVFSKAKKQGARLIVEGVGLGPVVHFLF